jgi:hypothetical protein
MDVDTVEKTGDNVVVATKTLTPPVIPKISNNMCWILADSFETLDQLMHYHSLFEYLQNFLVQYSLSIDEPILCL